MGCGITVPPYTAPLTISTPTTFNWWSAESADLVTWAEPWVVSILLKLPEARLHGDHSSVLTSSGSKWKHNLASEGLNLQIGPIQVNLDTATELALADPSSASLQYEPSYGRGVSLSTPYTPVGTALKSAYITTLDSSNNSAADLLVCVRYTPATSDSPAWVDLIINGVALFQNPMSAPGSGLVMADFSVSPKPVHDSIGEIALTQAWINDGVTEPNYTVIPHSIPFYPGTYIGISPRIQYLQINRGTSDIPSESSAEPITCSYLHGSWVKLSMAGTSPAGLVKCAHLSSISITVSAIDGVGNLVPDSGICEMWWDTKSRGMLKIGSGIMLSGFVTIVCTPSIADIGTLMVLNKSFSHGPYMLTNPTYLSAN